MKYELMAIKRRGVIDVGFREKEIFGDVCVTKYFGTSLSMMLYVRGDLKLKFAFLDY